MRKHYRGTVSIHSSEDAVLCVLRYLAYTKNNPCAFKSTLWFLFQIVEILDRPMDFGFNLWLPYCQRRVFLPFAFFWWAGMSVTLRIPDFMRVSRGCWSLEVSHSVEGRLKNLERKVGVNRKLQKDMLTMYLSITFKFKSIIHKINSRKEQNDPAKSGGLVGRLIVKT